MARLLLLLSFSTLVGSCIAPTSTTTPTPGGAADICRQTPESAPLGRVGGNLAARGIPAGGLTAGSELKVLWFVRVPHEDVGLRLAVERLDGPGTGRVTKIDRAGPGSVPLPAGWERSAAFPSSLTFEVAGCWRIHDIDGSDADAVVIQVSSN
jgi:hypothetical protein